jgi:hypothetical protein
MTLGTVLLAAERQADAGTALRRALGAYEAKQNVASAARARAALEHLTALEA